MNGKKFFVLAIVLVSSVSGVAAANSTNKSWLVMGDPQISEPYIDRTYDDITDLTDWAESTSRPMDFGLVVGDLANNGRDGQFQNYVGNMSEIEQSTNIDQIYHTPGNHDSFEHQQGWNGVKWMYRRMNMTSMNYCQIEGNTAFCSIAMMNGHFENWDTQYSNSDNIDYFIPDQWIKDWERQQQSLCERDMNIILMTHPQIYDTNKRSANWAGIDQQSWKDSSDKLLNTMTDSCSPDLFLNGHLHSDPEDYWRSTGTDFGGTCVWGAADTSDRMPDRTTFCHAVTVDEEHGQDNMADYASIQLLNMVEGRTYATMEAINVTGGTGKEVGITYNDTSDTVKDLKIDFKHEIQFSDSDNNYDRWEEYSFNPYMYADESKYTQWYKPSEGFWTDKSDTWVIEAERFNEVKDFQEYNLNWSESSEGCCSVDPDFAVTDTINPDGGISSLDWKDNVSDAGSGKYWWINISIQTNSAVSITGSELTADSGKGGVIPVDSGTPFFVDSSLSDTSQPVEQTGQVLSGESLWGSWIVNATGEPDNSYNFSVIANSTNPNVATVESGKQVVKIVGSDSKSGIISLDEQADRPFFMDGSYSNHDGFSGSFLPSSTLTFTGLVNVSASTGSYDVNVFANSSNPNVGKVYSSNTTVSISTNDTMPPSINIESPTNTTYSSSEVDLNVTSSEAVSTWEFSLDGANNVTFTDNMTLTGLSDGGHTVDVYATDSTGNTGSESVSFTVDTSPDDNNPSVSLSLNATSILVNESVEASVTASDDNQVDSVELDWTGDGVYEESSSGSSLTVSRQFNDRGLYDVTARATDNASQSSTDTVTLDVDPEFSGSQKGVLKECGSTNSSDSFCLVNRSGEEVFQEGFTNDDNTTLTAEVDVLDGVTGVFEFFGFAESTGQHNELVESSKVNVTVQDSSTEEPSNSAPSATYTISPTDPTPGETISFDGSGSSDSDGSIESFEWDFGDGSTGTGETVSHSYSSEGDYTVSLTVTDDDGATGSYSNSVPVQSETSSGGGGGGDDGTNDSIDDGSDEPAEASLDGSSVSLLAPYSASVYKSENSISVEEGGSQTITYAGREQTIEVTSINDNSVELNVNGLSKSLSQGEKFDIEDSAVPLYISSVIDTQNKSEVSIHFDIIDIVSQPEAYFAYNYSLDGSADVDVLVKGSKESSYQVINSTSYSSSGVDTVSFTDSFDQGIYTAKIRLSNSNGSVESRPVGFYMGNVPTIDVLRPGDGTTVSRPVRQNEVSIPLDFSFYNRQNVSVNVSTDYTGPTGEKYVGDLEATKFIEEGDTGLVQGFVRKVADLAFSWTDRIEFGPEVRLVQNSSVYVNGTGDFVGRANVVDERDSSLLNASSVPVTVTVERFDLTSDSDAARDHFDRRDGDSQRTLVESNSTNVSVDGSNESRYYDSVMVIYSPNNNEELVTEDLASFSPTVVHDFAVNSTATVNRSLVLEKVNSSESATIDLNPLRTEYNTEVDGSYFNGSWTEGTYEVYGETYYSNGSVIQRIDTGHSFSVVEDKRGLMEYVFGSVVDSVTTVYDFTVERARLIVALMVMVGWFAGMKTQGFDFIGKYGAAAWFVVFSYLNFIPGGIQAVALTLVVGVLVLKFLGGEIDL